MRPTTNDTRASFSNWGKCVDIFAPGATVVSDWLNCGTMTLSGTTVASAYVTGVVASLWMANPSLKPSEIQATLLSKASSGIIDMRCVTDSCELTPNLMVYNTCQ